MTYSTEHSHIHLHLTALVIINSFFGEVVLLPATVRIEIENSLTVAASSFACISPHELKTISNRYDQSQLLKFYHFIVSTTRSLIFIVSNAPLAVDNFYVET